jgi:uncharacterized membrane protein YqjE
VNIFAQTLVDWLRRTYIDPLVGILRARAAVVFLEGVKGVRRVLIVLCLLTFIITLIGAGFVLIPLAILVLMPWDPQTRAIVGIVIGVVYLLVPLAGILLILPEKRWMAITGAQDFADKLQR